jgi:hypothetical protein
MPEIKNVKVTAPKADGISNSVLVNSSEGSHDGNKITLRNVNGFGSKLKKGVKYTIMWSGTTKRAEYTAINGDTVEFKVTT